MKYFYTDHLLFRMGLRDIPEEFPREIYQHADERYRDMRTGRKIAVKRVEFQGRVREMAVVYEEEANDVRLVTIYPLKQGQKDQRIINGRWQLL